METVTMNRRESSGPCEESCQQRPWSEKRNENLQYANVAEG